MYTRVGAACSSVYLLAESALGSRPDKPMTLEHNSVKLCLCRHASPSSLGSITRVCVNLTVPSATRCRARSVSHGFYEGGQPIVEEQPVLTWPLACLFWRPSSQRGERWIEIDGGIDRRSGLAIEQPKGKQADGDHRETYPENNGCHGPTLCDWRRRAKHGDGSSALSKLSCTRMHVSAHTICWPSFASPVGQCSTCCSPVHSVHRAMQDLRVSSALLTPPRHVGLAGPSSRTHDSAGCGGASRR